MALFTSNRIRIRLESLLRLREKENQYTYQQIMDFGITTPQNAYMSVLT